MPSPRVTLPCFWLGGVISLLFGHAPDSSPGPMITHDISFDAGRQVYKLACVHCHKQDGSGISSQVPPLVASPWLRHATDEQLACALLHGLHGSMYSGHRGDAVMPGLGLWLTDDQIAAATGFVRARFGDRRKGIPTETVARIRSYHSGRTMPWSRRELDQAHGTSRVLTPTKP